MSSRCGGRRAHTIACGDTASALPFEMANAALLSMAAHLTIEDVPGSIEDRFF
jgi:hypothetical protein